MNSKNHVERGYGLDFGLANHLALIACFMSYKKWASVKKLTI